MMRNSSIKGINQQERKKDICPKGMLLHLLLLLLLLHILWLAAGESSSASLALPRCQEKCGGIDIPYPFGIGAGCYRNESEGFEIICDDSLRPPRPFIASNIQLQVMEASLEAVRIKNSVAYDCFNKSEVRISDVNAFIDLDNTTFTISATRNKFTVIGCDILGFIGGNKRGNQSRTFNSGCFSLCASEEDVDDETCNGAGCCSTAIPENLESFVAVTQSVFNQTNVSDFSLCGYAFIADQERYSFSKTHLSEGNFVDKIRDDVPVVLDWVVGNETCGEAKSKSTYACRANSSCADSTNGLGYRCKCFDGFEGNPYLPEGCQDIDECKNSTLCAEKCINLPGSYSCFCPDGTYGDGKRDGQGCIKKVPVIKIILGVGIGLAFLLFFGTWLYWGLKRRRVMKLREKFFRQNGGLMLQQHISLHQGATEANMIFSAGELEKATENYNDSRIIGKGGYGVVYKGILADNRVVAIKKARIVDKNQIEQFINEVKILSQINHRNVVKLVGCCLETEVPLLVYEYVSNGTLFHHIHGDGHVSSLSWDNRLRIASETACALAYLHSAASIPIIHRDVKSANILLDDNYTAKVSDFGASRLVPIDKDQMTTLVQGTLGYLDPECLLTSQLTEKSDVYSFGVVLVELLTGKIPFSFKMSADDQRSLCQCFILLIKEDNLSEILDSRVVDEGIKEQVLAVAELAKRCLEVKGDERPTMKAVEAELEGLRRFEKHPWVHKNGEEMESLLAEHLQHVGGSTSGYDSITSHTILEIDMPR